MSKVFTVGAAQEWIDKEYGGLFEQRESTVSLSFGTYTQLVPPNADRTALLFANIGGSDSQVVPQSSLNSGITGFLISAIGGSVSMNIRDDFNLPTLQWSANAQAVGGTTVFVLEVVRLVRTENIK
jgi:hypothetical protein